MTVRHFALPMGRLALAKQKNAKMVQKDAATARPVQRSVRIINGNIHCARRFRKALNAAFRTERHPALCKFVQMAIPAMAIHLKNAKIIRISIPRTVAAAPSATLLLANVSPTNVQKATIRAICLPCANVKADNGSTRQHVPPIRHAMPRHKNVSCMNANRMNTNAKAKNYIIVKIINGTK